VACTFDLLLSGESKLRRNPHGSWWVNVEKVTADDDFQVTFRLKEPQPSLIAVLASGYTPIYACHVPVDQMRRRPIGTGPFKLVEYIQGDRIRYEKNEKYYIPGQPAFDELVLRIIPDAAARVAAFEKGEVDMLYNNSMPFTEIERIRKFPGVEIRDSNVSGSAFLGIINMKGKPYDDVRVRQALAHGINRGFIRDNVMPGFSQNQIGPLPPSMSLANKDLKDYAYDPKRANELLDAAGYPRKADGTRFEFRLLWAANDIRITKMADVIRQNLSDVGITTSLQPLERAALNQKGYISEQFDMIIDSYAQGPDPDIGTERLYISTNIFNPPRVFTNNSSYINPEVDRLFEEQRRQIDPAKRKEIYDKIQVILWEAVAVLPILAYSGVGAFRATVMSDAFNSADASKDSFARVTLPAATGAALAAGPEAGNGKTIGYTAAGAAVVAAGAWWLWRRKSRRDDGLDETA